MKIKALVSVSSLALSWLVGGSMADFHWRHRGAGGRAVVYVDTLFLGCTKCSAKEGAAAGTGSVKDLVLECCTGSPTGSIVTSGYSLVSGACRLDGENCQGVTACEFSVTLTIQMGCHAELWVDRPDMDPDDDGRITESLAVNLALSVPCGTQPTANLGEVSVKVSRRNCSTPGTKGEQVGEYTAKVKCERCS